MDLVLVGDHLPVPLVTGGVAPYVNLDYAASTPALDQVVGAVAALLPWYSSVHRGAGYKSQVSTEAYEQAREQVRAFVGGRPDDCVIFTQHTTHALNLLINSLPDDAVVVCWAASHHAALLPGRRRQLIILPIPSSPGAALLDLEDTLRTRRVDLVIVTGASNVTGETWPYGLLTEIAHDYGARVALDAAQLAAHRPIDITASDVDWVAFSGHKCYAPFGAGALVGRCHWLGTSEPYLLGGGAVDYVHADEVAWTTLPDRQEAGSPNVLGAVALGVACKTLSPAVLSASATRERVLHEALERVLVGMPGVQLHRMWPTSGCDRIGVTCWTCDQVPYARLAAVLSAEHGIGVRHGCFCAHPLMAHLLGIDPVTARELGKARGGDRWIPGAVRASLGLGVTGADIVALVGALALIGTGGVSWTYTGTPDGTDCWPDPDPRRCDG